MYSLTGAVYWPESSPPATLTEVWPSIRMRTSRVIGKKLALAGSVMRMRPICATGLGESVVRSRSVSAGPLTSTRKTSTRRLMSVVKPTMRNREVCS